jgi:hypothetical protein
MAHNRFLEVKLFVGKIVAQGLARMGRVSERGSRREGEACAAAEEIADGEEKLVLYGEEAVVERRGADYILDVVEDEVGELGKHSRGRRQKENKFIMRVGTGECGEGGVPPPSHCRSWEILRPTPHTSLHQIHGTHDTLKPYIIRLIGWQKFLMKKMTEQREITPGNIRREKLEYALYANKKYV